MSTTLVFAVENTDSIIRAFNKSETMSLRKLSDHIMAEGAMQNNRNLIRLAVATHALSSILEKNYYRSKKSEWERFVKTVVSGLHEYKKNEGAISKVEAAIIKLDEVFGRYTDNVLHRSRVRKGSTLYAWGMTLTLAAEMVGVEESEILSQSGQTKMVDEEGSTIHASKRLEHLEGIL